MPIPERKLSPAEIEAYNAELEREDEAWARLSEEEKRRRRDEVSSLAALRKAAARKAST